MTLPPSLPELLSEEHVRMITAVVVTVQKMIVSGLCSGIKTKGYGQDSSIRARPDCLQTAALPRRLALIHLHTRTSTTSPIPDGLLNIPYEKSQS